MSPDEMRGLASLLFHGDLEPVLSAAYKSQIPESTSPAATPPAVSFDEYDFGARMTRRAVYLAEEKLLGKEDHEFFEYHRKRMREIEAYLRGPL